MLNVTFSSTLYRPLYVSSRLHWMPLLFPKQKNLLHFLGTRKVARGSPVRGLKKEASFPPPRQLRSMDLLLHASLQCPISVINHLACYNQCARYFFCEHMRERHKHDICKRKVEWKGFMFCSVVWHSVLDYNYRKASQIIVRIKWG